MRRPTLTVVVLAMLLRLIVLAFTVSDQQRVFNSDAYEFAALGKNLVTTGHYSRSTEAPFVPEVEITPLQPFVISLLYRVFGVHYPIVLLLNILLAGAIAAILSRVGGVAGPTAALLFALDPTSIVYAGMFTADTAFTFLILAAVALLAAALDMRGPRAYRWLAVAGLVFGVAVLEKPAALYLPVILLPAALFNRRRQIPAIPFLALFIATWAIVVAPWLMRNKSVLGITTISSTQEVNLLYWNVGVLEASVHGIGRAAAAAELEREVGERAGRPFVELSEGEQLNFAREVAIEHIMARPFSYAFVHLRGSLMTLLDPGRLDLSRLAGGIDVEFSVLEALTRGGVLETARLLLQRPSILLPLMLAIAGWLALLYLAALRGLWRQLRIVRDRPILWLGGWAVAYLLVIGGPIGNARFRVPCVPFIALFAAHGLRRESDDVELADGTPSSRPA